MAGTDIILQGLSVGYRGRTLIEGLDARFPASTLTALVGRNGSGKSTLLRTMAGLTPPLSGEVIFRGGSEDAISPTSGALPTNDASSAREPALTKNSLPTSREPALTKNSLPTSRELALAKNSPPPSRLLALTVGFVSTERVRVANLRVRDLVALGRIPHTDWTGRLTPADLAATTGALSMVGIEPLADKRVDTLSDGEAQKVMIARVLAQDTPVVLLDEPTAFLDFVARREVCELLRRLTRETGKTVVFSSHELDLAREFADHRLSISEGGKINFQ